MKYSNGHGRGLLCVWLLSIPPEGVWTGAAIIISLCFLCVRCWKHQICTKLGPVQYKTPCTLQSLYTLCILYCSLDNTANKIPTPIKGFFKSHNNCRNEWIFANGATGVFGQLKVSVAVRTAQEFLWKTTLLDHCSCTHSWCKARWIINWLSQFFGNWHIHCGVIYQRYAGVNGDAPHYNSQRSEITIVTVQDNFSDSRYFNHAKSMRLKFQLWYDLCSKL